jgi:hypothetical protein
MDFECLVSRKERGMRARLAKLRGTYSTSNRRSIKKSQ